MLDIGLMGCSADRLIPAGASPPEMGEFSISHSAQFEMTQTNILVVKLTLDLKANGRVGETGDHLPVCNVQAVYAVRYEVQPRATFSRADLKAFVKLNALFNAWPYLREFIDSTTRRLGLPPMVLQLLRIGAKR